MSEINPIAFATELGVTIAILIGGGAVAGYYIGGHYGNTAIGAIAGATTGLALTFIYLFTRLRSLPK